MIGTICNIEYGEFGKIVDRIPFDIRILTNLEGIFYKYDDAINFAYPIRAMGRVGHEIFHRHEDVRFVQVIWKERFCALVIEDRYYF